MEQQVSLVAILPLTHTYTPVPGGSQTQIVTLLMSIFSVLAIQKRKRT